MYLYTIQTNACTRAWLIPKEKRGTMVVTLNVYVKTPNTVITDVIKGKKTFK